MILGCLITGLIPVPVRAEIKTWTGYGGDSYWLNPLNWSGLSLPVSSDDVLLDNGDLPVSYQVLLPDIAVILKTLHIIPSPGRNIELILPATNNLMNAFTVTGPGYGIELNAGAIFRNASGLSSGESLSILDSMMIHDGARYIHQTRAGHANGILNILSTAAGTEQGVFDFDVPRASYTISVSNRTYGSLELHSTAQGSTVNYTCTGANPLLVRGDLRIGSAVNVSMNLSGVNGNIQVEGDFIQEGGQFNLASGANAQTVFHVRGDLYQSATAIITETNNGIPFIDLNGSRLQQTALAGQITNQVGFRISNIAGTALRLPLKLPWILDLKEGPVFSSATALLTLGTDCELQVDSVNAAGAYVEGPLRKEGLVSREHFIFPVGGNGNIRWLELKNATGNYTVEYIRGNPADQGTNILPPLDHISKIEYWTILADGVTDNAAIIELSFASALSGGVTDPAFLNVAKLLSGYWQDAGHTGVTGNYVRGSVLSGNTDFLASQYTLASTVNMENPLPLTQINLSITEISSRPVFFWTVESTEIPDHFDLLEIADGKVLPVTRVKAVPSLKKYNWTGLQEIRPGKHFFRIRMTDIHAHEYEGGIIEYIKDPVQTVAGWISNISFAEKDGMIIQSLEAGPCIYDIIAIDGRILHKGNINLIAGINHIHFSTGFLPTGIYVFHIRNSSGKDYVRLFKN